LLPDYPKLKARLTEIYRERVRRVHDQHLGIFSAVPPAIMHEGRTHVLTREDGSSDEMEPKRVQAGAELRLDFREVEKLEAKDVWKVLDTIAEGLAKEKFQTLLTAIDEAATKVGNVTTLGTSALEQFFEATEKRWIEFDADGNPAPVQFLAGSEATARKLRDAMKQIETDPDLRRQYETIIEKKRQQWRDREAARKLVE
jgi:metal-dependent amidase/aminoacylase/carboxypeptidase family protein